MVLRPTLVGKLQPNEPVASRRPLPTDARILDTVTMLITSAELKAGKYESCVVELPLRASRE
jgi:hypothetical protein